MGGGGGGSEGFCITERFKIARFYPDMRQNGVNTQWVYPRIQKPLDLSSSVQH